MPAEYRRFTLADYPASVRAQLAPFFDGRRWSAYLWGSVGTGKSCLAGAMLRECRETRISRYEGGWGEFLTPERLRSATLDLERGFIRFAAWQAAAVLVLDDLAALRGTPHVVEHLIRLIGTRYDERRATIVTSNLSLDALGQHLDPRIASRFQAGLVLDLGQVDRRRGNSQSAIRNSQSEIA